MQSPTSPWWTIWPPAPTTPSDALGRGGESQWATAATSEKKLKPKSRGINTPARRRVMEACGKPQAKTKLFGQKNFPPGPNRAGGDPMD